MLSRPLDVQPGARARPRRGQGAPRGRVMLEDVLWSDSAPRAHLPLAPWRAGSFHVTSPLPSKALGLLQKKHLACKPIFSAPGRRSGQGRFVFTSVPGSPRASSLLWSRGRGCAGMEGSSGPPDSWVGVGGSARGSPVDSASDTEALGQPLLSWGLSLLTCLVGVDPGALHRRGEPWSVADDRSPSLSPGSRRKAPLQEEAPF